MAAEVGEEHFFMFGLTADQVAASRGWYSPGWHYDNEAETRAALDLIFSGYFNQYEPGVFEPLRHTLLTGGDHYMHLGGVLGDRAVAGELPRAGDIQDRLAYPSIRIVV